jgi:hypothetical protein
MSRKDLSLPIVILAAAIAEPAAANYFSNPTTNTMLNIGSAPSPTPDDLRLIGEGYYRDLTFDLKSVVGKPVYTRNQEYIGPVRSVDEVTRIALVQLPGGIAVPLSANDIRDVGDRVVLPKLSQQQIGGIARAKGVITGPSTDK